jgi:hypothetical protein
MPPRSIDAPLPERQICMVTKVLAIFQTFMTFEHGTVVLSVRLKRIDFLFISVENSPESRGIRSLQYIGRFLPVRRSTP